MKSQKIFTLIILISIPFLVWYLYRLDLLSLDIKKSDYLAFSVSLLLLFLGFVLSAISWKYALKAHNYSISYKKAIASHGMPVFAKYIPGKVWVILGRASSVANDSLPLKIASFVSLKEQLVYLLLGLIISFPFLFENYNNPYFPFFVGIIALGLGVFLTVRRLHNLFLLIYFKIFKKELEIPFISFSMLLKLSGVVLLYWMVWISAFYVLLISMPFDVSLTMAFCFPVSICMGLLAIVIPAGIGVREGIIVSFLVATGLKLDHAITVSLVSRVWFVIGEIFIFSFSLILNRKNKSRSI